MVENPFTAFVGYEVKAPYKDGSHFKVARGVVEELDDDFVRVNGRLGKIVLNVRNIESMSIMH